MSQCRDVCGWVAALMVSTVSAGGFCGSRAWMRAMASPAVMLDAGGWG